jgi:histidine kinase
MLRSIRSHLALKIFLSYLVVILVGSIVLASATEFSVPRSFNRHMAAMSSMMGEIIDEPTEGIDLNSDLFKNFRAAVNEALILAAGAAFFVAIFINILVSRRIVAPVREMMIASKHITEGNYSERVHVPGNQSPDEMDELAQLGVSFNQMADKLEKTEAVRRQLIADVAHELRTPLTAIKGSMEGLIDNLLPAEPTTYQQIYREADRLQRLVDDLQDLSRVEAGAFDLQLRSTTIHNLVKTATAKLDYQYEEKGVQLKIDLPSELPAVTADEDRISQVLLNLVGNALQYTPPGGRVDIRASIQAKEILISVSDTGIGISAEHIPNVFTRFYRVDKSRTRASGGSGVGLTIAKHLVEAHNGRIWAESPGRDQGSTFFFTLPLAE